MDLETIRVHSHVVDKRQISRQRRCVYPGVLLVTLALLKFFGGQRKVNRATAQML